MEEEETTPHSEKQRTTPRRDSSVLTHSTTRGKARGVGSPITFAPLGDKLEQVTHVLRSDDSLRDSLTFVSRDDTKVVLESLTTVPGIERGSGWWCMDQDGGAWWATGHTTFKAELDTPATIHEPISDPHHHGTGAWIAPIERVPGVEAVVFAGDFAARPGEGDSPSESVRRPSVSLLLSQPTAPTNLTSRIEMPFYETPGDADSGYCGMARLSEWGMQTRSFEMAGKRTCEVLEVRSGLNGPEVEVTNPYYTQADEAVRDFGDHRQPGRGGVGMRHAARLAGYERLTAHPTPAAPSADDLTIGTEVTLASLRLTWLANCGITFTPLNAEVRIE